MKSAADCISVQALLLAFLAHAIFAVVLTVVSPVLLGMSNCDRPRFQELF